MEAFSYEPESTSKIYLKLFYGVCRQDSTAGTDHCVLWTDTAAWQHLDDMNDAVAKRQSLLADAAANNWPFVKYITVICLVISFVLFVFFCVVACIGEVAWKMQMVAAVTQLALALLLAFSLGWGLRTDTVKPQMFGTFFYSCDVHAEPGASWWFGVLALVCCIYAGFLLMFPYLGGPTWVLKWAKSGAVAPSDGDEARYNRHRAELELDEDSDPFAGIYLVDDDDQGEVLGSDEEWATDDGQEDGYDEEAPPPGAGAGVLRRLSSADSAEKYKEA